MLSLFAGIGGLDLGLEWAGMTVIGQVESDPFCRSVLAAHWPEVPRHAEVRTCVDWWLGQPRPTVDVVAGGFPCQPVSQAGAKQAQKDPRWLWPHMAAVIAALRPAWVIAENVPGLLRRGFGDVLRDLATIGFDAEWDCVPAAAVGAPHLRDRVFIVARLQRPQSVAHTHGDGLEGKPQSDLGTPTRVPAPLGHDADGRGRVVANTEGDRRGAGGPGRPEHDAAAGQGVTPPGLADTDGRRRPARSESWPGDRPEPSRGDPRDMAHPDRPGPQRPRIFRAAPHRDEWPTEPGVRRVANGVPHQMDRLRSLGNAVVPQVAEHIGRLVMSAAP
jgi:DNA (cytosine-5)-methyltransferase 1